jgi:hypothetical protein
MATPNPLMASFEAAVGSLVTTLKRMSGVTVFCPGSASKLQNLYSGEVVRSHGLPDAWM